MIQRNSWTKHVSLSWNLKYNFTLRATWLCYESFGTLALGIYLFTENNTLERCQRYFTLSFQESIQDGVVNFNSGEFQLCVVCMTLEFLPQAILLFVTGELFFSDD